MTSLLNLIPNALPHNQSELVYAEIAAPAPISFSDPLFLVFPDWSRDFPVAIPDWPACHGVTLPLVGDAALLVVDTRGLRRCVWWEGRMSFSSQTSRAYYMTNTASDIAGHLQLSVDPYSSQTRLSFPGLVNGRSLLDYATPPGVPDTSFLPAGQFELHVHAAQISGNETVQLYAEFWEAQLDGTHISRIGVTQTSPSLTATEVEYRLFFSTSSPYSFASISNRLSIHVYALVGGGGGTSVVIYIGGTTDSHVVIPLTGTISTFSWAAPGLTNSWANVGGVTETVGYLKDPSGFIRLKGLIVGGPSGSTAFTLPAGYRPGASAQYGLSPKNGIGTAVVDVSGHVTITYTVGGTNMSFAGITFLAEN